MRRRLLAATATAALSLGLVACGDDSEGPVTEAPPSLGIGGSDGGGASDDGGEASDGGGSDDGGDATGSEGENSAAEEAGIPAPDPADYPGMDENTAEGAEQFTRYFIAVMTWGYQSGIRSCSRCCSTPTAIFASRTQMIFEPGVNPGIYGRMCSMRRSSWRA